MTQTQHKRGAAPVGVLEDLDGIEAATVIYMRMWTDGPDAQAQVWNDFATGMGRDKGRCALRAFESLCALCARHGRRPLMRHGVYCKCLGADEACFANFVATAATGEREDALFIATLLVRADVAPLLVSMAADVGLALLSMQLTAPRDLAPRAHTQTLH